MIRVKEESLSYDEANDIFMHQSRAFTGISLSFFPSGEPVGETELREGRTWGLEKAWHRSGILAGEAEYVNCVLHGLAKEWNASGVLISSGEYEYGIAIREETWSEDGQLAKDYHLIASDPDYEILQGLKEESTTNG